MKRSLTEAEKKHVAARQCWRCDHCNKLLEATFQIDHVIALTDGGRDHVLNCVALCVSCHARKSHKEVLARSSAKWVKSIKNGVAENREDVVVSKTLQQCTTCGQKRPVYLSWSTHVCPGKPRISLEEFAFQSQVNTE